VFLPVSTTKSVTEIVAAVGEQVVLPCYSTTPVDWKRGQKEIAINDVILNGDSSRLRLHINSTNEHHLIIPNVTVADANTYTCIEDNGAGTHHVVKLTVSGA